MPVFGLGNQLLAGENHLVALLDLFHNVQVNVMCDFGVLMAKPAGNGVYAYTLCK